MFIIGAQCCLRALTCKAFFLASVDIFCGALSRCSTDSCVFVIGSACPLPASVPLTSVHGSMRAGLAQAEGFSNRKLAQQNVHLVRTNTCMGCLCKYINSLSLPKTTPQRTCTRRDFERIVGGSHAPARLTSAHRRTRKNYIREHESDVPG